MRTYSPDSPEAAARIIALLLGASTGGGLTGGIDAPTLAALMAEIKSPELQRKVLALAGAAAEADEHLAEAELIVLSAARQHWGLTAA